MILLERRGQRFRCASAFIAGVHDEERLCGVSCREDVLAFLVQHPDRYFFLIHDATIEDSSEPAEKDAIFCGLVKLVSKDGELVNRRFSFSS
jgi:hypothetical protein